MERGWERVREKEKGSERGGEKKRERIAGLRVAEIPFASQCIYHMTDTGTV